MVYIRLRAWFPQERDISRCTVRALAEGEGLEGHKEAASGDHIYETVEEMFERSSIGTPMLRRVNSLNRPASPEQTRSTLSTLGASTKEAYTNKI